MNLGGLAAAEEAIRLDEEEERKRKARPRRKPALKVVVAHEAKEKARHELYEVVLAVVLMAAILLGMDHEGAVAIVALRCVTMVYELIHGLGA